MSLRFASRIRSAGLILALCLAASQHPSAQSAPAAVPGGLTLLGQAFGHTVALTWTPASGATSYDIGVGGQSNAYTLIQNVGATLALVIDAPPGIYYVRVAGRNASGLGALSNEVTIIVTPPAGPPPAGPTNLQASVAGSHVGLSWQLGPGGGPAGALVFAISSSPGGFNLGLIPVGISTQTSTPAPPPGTYFTRLYAVGPGGVSPASNEVPITIGPAGCAVPVPPVLTAAVAGTTVNFSWTPVPGVVGYRLEAAAIPGGPAIFAQGVNAATTGLSVPGVPAGVFHVRVAAVTACGTEAMGPEAVVQVQAAAGRTPDPPPGQRLPLPNRLSVLQELARQFPADLRNSCVEHGGTNTFLFRVVQRLRQQDTRWGLNWKRGNRGDMSQDVINYHWGPGPDEDSRDTYVLDIIVGHCGPNPGVNWNDVTGAGGADARWTLIPYTNAGFRP